MKNILVIGGANVDVIMEMERFPQPGETVTGDRFHQVYGGKGANQAVAAARSGGNVKFIACLGKDFHAEVMTDNYRNDGIDTQYLFRDKELNTGTAMILIDKEGENCIAVALEANARLSPDHLKKSSRAFQDSGYVLLQCELPDETVIAAIEMAHQGGSKPILNLAPATRYPDDIFRKVDTLVVNETEAAFLLGRPIDPSQALQAAKGLRKWGPEVAIVTCGAAGSYFSSERDEGHAPAFKVTPKDTTAAGDTFCGALATALASGQFLKGAIQFANAAAAISVTRLGAQPSIPKRNEIEKFLNDML